MTADLELIPLRYQPGHYSPITFGDNAIEKVQAPLAGTYFVEVKAVSGASNYILTMGQGITEATIMDERLRGRFHARRHRGQIQTGSSGIIWKQPSFC